MDFMQVIFDVWGRWRKQKILVAIAIGFGLNLIIAPMVYAASNSILDPQSALALGVLGVITLALVIYLFVVIFQPERF